MGAVCTCTSEEELLKDKNPTEIAAYRNDLLKLAKFNYFGKILSLSSFQSDDKQNPWGNVKKNFNKDLLRLNLYHSFKVEKPRKSNLHLPDSQYDNGDDQDCLILHEGEEFKLGIELYDALFIKEELSQLRLVVNLVATDTAVINIETNKGGHGRHLVYEGYVVPTQLPIDLAFSKSELHILAKKQDNKPKSLAEQERIENGLPSAGRISNSDAASMSQKTGRKKPELTMFYFKHMGGVPLKIKDIELNLSQSCDRFVGTFAQLAQTEDLDDNFFGDIKQGMVQPKVQILRHIEDKNQKIDWMDPSDLPEAQFLNIEVEGRTMQNEDIQALIVSNEGKSLKVSIEFYVPTHILNMRVTNDHVVKLNIFHFSPNKPHVRFSLNGKHDEQIYVPKKSVGTMTVIENDREVEKDKPISILLDLAYGDLRKYNLLEIVITNQPEYYAIKKIELEMEQKILTSHLITALAKKGMFKGKADVDGTGEGEDESDDDNESKRTA